MNASYLSCRIAFVLALVAVAGPALAQRDRPPLRATGAAGPMMGVRPGVWSAASSYVVNATDADADVLAAIGFERGSTMQFARQLWLPPHSMLYAWIPFHAPEFKPTEHTVLKVETLLLDARAAGTEHVLTRDEGFMIGQRDSYINVVALLSRRDDTAGMVLAARRSIDSNDRRERTSSAAVISISPERLSPCPQTFGEFDSLVLGDTANQLDLAQLQSVRQWVASGKTLWIVGGEVDDDHLQMLLGDAWTGQMIDRTELQDFTIVGRHSPTTVHTEDPVELVRMVPGENMTVRERVNGYPAAVEFPLGAGRVFITTLGPAGWTTSPNHASAALSELGQVIFAPENFQPTLPAKLDPQLTALAPAQVGYKTVPRSMVMGLLAGFCIAFLISGIVLLRAGRAEWFVGAGLGLAVLASAGLLLGARSANEAVPLTVASAAVTQIFPRQQSSQQQAHVAVYNPGPAAAGPVESQVGGLFWPTSGLPLGGQPRLVFTDRDRWQWRGLGVTPGALGMLHGEYSASADLAQPVHVVVHLTDTDAEANADTGAFGPLADVLLAGPNGAMLAHPGIAGAFLAGDADLAHNDQYTTGSVLTDTQREHQEVYHRLFADVSTISEPTLLGFASGAAAGVTLPGDVLRRQTQLLSVPVEFAPPAAGSVVTIPSAFIPFEVIRIPDLSVGMFPYSTMQHTWIPNLSGQQPTQQLLQFTLPRALLPMKLTAVTFDLALRAPERNATLFKLAGKRPITIASVHGPVGVVEAKLTGADCPAVDSAGHIIFGFTVTPDSDPKHTWDISDARISVTAEKLPRAADDAPPIRSQPNPPTAGAAK